MSQREEMRSLIELKRALERDMGITIDMDRFGVKQRLLRLAQASGNPDVAALVRRLETPDAPESTPDEGETRRIRGYYRGRPIFDE
ncbi:hypothetical protein LV476_09720 [Guyparkeria hydrothermalis]|uniref:hypothetical protein n=1 Tax=Guyparkeria hydrothermalis TaxID=923 RepID=UPI002020B33B|nr:hypothetical protein [Guyparkeria hydrothermalis]MCL7745213.1 hypothetical protein [Guyparkeria hydrothermalis]